MITFHLSSQVETFVLNNPAYTRWWCSSSDASSTNRDKLLFGKFSQDVFFNIEYFVGKKTSFYIKKLEKIHEKGILLKGNVSGFLSFETSARLYPLAHFVNLVQDEWEDKRELS